MTRDELIAGLYALNVRCDIGVERLADELLHDFAQEIDKAKIEGAKEVESRYTSQKVMVGKINVWNRYGCPACNICLHKGMNTPENPPKFCHNCGQALQWN